MSDKKSFESMPEKTQLQKALLAHQEAKKARGETINYGRLPRAELFMLGAGTKAKPNTKTDVYVMSFKDPDAKKTHLTKNEARWMVVVPKPAAVEIETVHLPEGKGFFAFQDTEGGFPVRVMTVMHHKVQAVALVVLEHSPKDKDLWSSLV